MNNGIKTVVKFADQMTWCIASAVASAAGTTLWHTVLKPKVLDAMDTKKKAHKNPIGFRVD